MSNRVALLTNIPTPYRLPWYRELSRRCDLLVVFDEHAEPNRKWTIAQEDVGFRHTYAEGFQIPYQRKREDLSIEDERYLQIRYGILPALRSFKPEVIVSPEMGTRTMQAAAYSRLTGTPLILWWEGTRHTEALTGRGKSFIRRLLVGEAQRFWSNGRESNESLLDYGASADVIDEGMTGVDTAFYEQEVNKLLPERENLRSMLGLEGVVFLFVGQFTERKGLYGYLDALTRLYATGLREWSAVFVGSGPLEGVLRSWKEEHREVRVLIEGFVQPRDLPKFYASADVFVMSTLEDVWGLVCLEAAVAGLPQLFSIYAGCTSDLLRDERMGREIDPLKIETFTAALEDYVRNPPARLPDELVRQIADYYAPERLAERSIKSIERALR